MEVVLIKNDNINSKADIWADRLHAFRKSGLSRKDWCLQNDIPQSTLGYWLRKTQLETHGIDSAPAPVFAKLPSEQDFQFNAGTGNSPMSIHLAENIRIEVGADCSARLMVALFQALKGYA